MDIPENKKIVLFDGVCNFCNASVRFIIKRDKKDKFRFASLQSDLGQKLTRERGIDTSEIDSIILIDPGNAYYIKSTAALEICKDLSGLYPALRLFLVLPEGFRNLIYDFVARHRYQWFGKSETCPMPSEEEQSKFLDT
ncbi:thiol-disulfide oxidoreductase DCC family protein [Psychroflexus sediminis]|uniref:Predicted thiol-disulfide oxidoreductase YuxK, DCC family n=1 Tax=Psychroflexus sediminis TaxID=470826 RepID=A0A1G7YX46_9FLAO|nr:DCC1-like thiol-disulfide oxidoreductase family protein [Psychroflexus sediminis]SDH01088.1 Predicted thiol-disulfide oxidoreductase YuxK, DCC family [Psychroflexus sediminis]